MSAAINLSAYHLLRACGCASASARASLGVCVFLQVHADVAAYARPFVKRVLSQLVVRVAKNLHTVMSNYNLLGHDPAAAIEQLRLEIAVFKRVLVKFDRDPSVWAEGEALLNGFAVPKKPRRRSRAPLPPAPTPSPALAPVPRTSKGKAPPVAPTKKGGRALPKPGRALPKPGGRKSLPKLPPKGGGRKLPSVGGAAAAPALRSPSPPLPVDPEPEPESLHVHVSEQDPAEELEAAVEAYLRKARFQHACFNVELVDEFDLEDLNYDDSEIQTALESAPAGDDDDNDDDDFV